MTLIVNFSRRHFFGSLLLMKESMEDTKDHMTVIFLLVYVPYPHSFDLNLVGWNEMKKKIITTGSFKQFKLSIIKEHGILLNSIPPETFQKETDKNKLD